MRFGIVGVGRMGRRHLQVAKNCGFEIVGVHDPSPDSVEAALREQGLPREIAFGSMEAMLARARPEVLVVASTATSHCEYVCQAAGAGGVRYILCEKPMAISLKECDRMIEACRRSSARLAVNHQMRFMEQYSVVKTAAESAQFGGLRSVTVAASNFGLAMNGAHYFEMFRFLAEAEIESVNCWLDKERVPNPRGPQYEDRSGQVRAVTRSGIRLYMECGSDQGHGIHVVYGCRLGQIFVDELGGFVRSIRRKPEYAELPTSRYGMPAIEEIRQIAPADVIAPTEAVLRAMIAGDSFPDGTVGRHAVAALVAANISGERDGSTVRLDDPSAIERSFPWA